MTNKDAETIHRIAGAIEVARHMVERSAGLYRRSARTHELEVIAALFDAADALDAVVGALAAESRPSHRVGPAA